MKKEVFLKRFKELSGMKKNPEESYLIKITFLIPLPESLNEHHVYQNFKKSTNRYTYHSETTNPPVGAHYQVYPNNSKTELYAVRVVDGKAHHKRNRGYQIPNKEADELRSYGVNIPPNNILETITASEVQLLNESLNVDNPIYILIS